MISLTTYHGIPLLGFAAFSGTGKTTLLEQLIPELNQANIRIAMVKHTHHEKFDIDKPGKDSYRLRKAGAEQMLVASAKRWALMVEQPFQERTPEPDLLELLAHLDLKKTDLILVEGFKHESISKIELHRPTLGKPLLYPDDPNIIAIATDQSHLQGKNGQTVHPDAIQCPLLDINNITEITDFISRLLQKNIFTGKSTMSQNDTLSPSMNRFLSVSEVQKRIINDTKAVDGTEQIDLRQALGRVLASDIIATFDTPPCDNSGMDGYAFSSKELTSDIAEQATLTLKIIGQSFAGHPYNGKIASGEAIRIMTGAQVPDGVDTVVMQEHTEQSSKQQDEQTVTITTIPKPFANVRKAGDDLTSGQTFLSKGKKLSPTDLAFLATQGIAEVKVSRKIRVAFFSTGDELRSIGETLGAGDIYDSNRYSLYGLLKNLDVEMIDMGVIPDDRQAIEEAFKTAADLADAVITSGGVSVGEADFVKETLEKLGQINFWKISMKPGKPLAFGTLGNSLFFGLPGNPVAVIATFYQFVQPALKRMKGQDIVLPLVIKAKTTELLKKRPGRTDFQRGILAQSDSGELTVRNAGTQASHVLTAMSRANCFIVIPAQSGSIEVGEMVDVQPFEGLMD